MNASEFDLGAQRSVRAIVGGAFGLYRRYSWLFLVLAGTVAVPYQLLLLAVTGAAPFGHQGGASLVRLVMDTALIGPLISALHIHGVVEIGTGREPRLGDVARRGTKVLPVVAAASVISAIGIFLGFLALIVPGIILGLRWAVVAQSAAIEPDGWRMALARSRQLTLGHKAHVAGVFVVGALIVGPATIAIGQVIGSDASMGNVVIGIAVFTISYSFTALTSAILYFDLVARYKNRERPADPEYARPRDLD